MYGLENYLNSSAKSWIYNKKRIQGYFSELCGQYCLLYLYCRCRNYSLLQFTNQFSFDANKNDEILNEKLKLKMSSINLTVYYSKENLKPRQAILQRALEILPGACSWSLLLGLIFLSIFFCSSILDYRVLSHFVTCMNIDTKYIVKSIILSNLVSRGDDKSMFEVS